MKKHLPAIIIIAVTITAFSACNKDSKVQSAGMKDFNSADALKSGAISGEIKLLESITYPGSTYNEVIRFEYDDRNRLIKVINHNDEIFTLTYNGSDLAGVLRTTNSGGWGIDYGTMSFHIGRNSIRISSFHSETVLSVNYEGYIIKSAMTGLGERSDTTYQYHGGNLIKHSTAAVFESETDFSGEAIENIVEYKYDDMISPFFHCNTPKWFVHYMYDLGLNNNIIERRDSPGGNIYTYAYEYDTDGYPARQTMTSPNGSTVVTTFTYRAAAADFDVSAGVGYSGVSFIEGSGFLKGSAQDQTAQISGSGMQEMSFSKVISGNMDSGQEIWYSVRTAEAGFLTVEASSFIDTFLIAYNSRLNHITENDDWNGLNPRIELKAEANTTYLFMLRGYNSSVNGPFQIMASFRPMPVITALYSGPGRGIIENGQERWYSVHADRFGILDIHTTGNTDTILEVYNTDFEFFNSDDNSGEFYNAQIKMEVKQGETWYIKLSSQGENSGAYEITAKVNPYPVPKQLSPGSFYNTYIESGDEHWYAVRAASDGLLTVETMGATDTTLEALTETYESIYYNDDTWAGDIVDRNARLEIFVSSPGGAVYIIRLRSFGSGSYRILASFDEVKG